MNVDKLKEARENLEAAREEYNKAHKEAEKQYREGIQKAKDHVTELEEHYVKVAKETKEELEKAGLIVQEKRKDYYDLDDPRDLRDWPKIPLWIAPTFFGKPNTYTIRWYSGNTHYHDEYRTQNNRM